MRTKELIQGDAELWRAATHHAFLDEVGGGTLAYSVQLTALWALERAYLEGWRTALPGAPPFREFVEHWTNDAFSTYVAALEAAANRAIGRGGDAERDAFRSVVKYEQAFWEMAYVRSNG